MAHWRYTFKPARFFMLDARASIVILLFLLHIRVWTFALAVFVVGLFYWVERYGYDFPSAIRAIRLYLSGKIRPAQSINKQQNPVEYDRRPLF